jgi:hypothetical protein
MNQILANRDFMVINKDNKPGGYIMGKLSNVNKTEILPEFQSIFLKKKKLAQEKNVFFYALWASKYFTYARKKQISSEKYQENAVLEFIESMKSYSHMSEWQIRQAQDALRLYYFHYRGFKPGSLSRVAGRCKTLKLIKYSSFVCRDSFALLQPV